MAFCIPIPSHSHSRTIVQSLWHKQFWPIDDSDCVHCLSLSLKLIMTARITPYCITFQHKRTSQTKENMPNGTLLWLTVVFYAKQDCHQNQSPMRIYCHGNKGHFHFHAGCFPFLPIPIPNFVINSHSHGIPITTGNPIFIVISTHNIQTSATSCALSWIRIVSK